MISIGRHGTKVKITIETGMATGGDLFLYWECSNELFAELLTTRLQRKLADRIEAIRQEEYNKGWKDAKSKKKAKQTWFTSVFRLFYEK